MKIKNTKELVARADWHAANDHIIQGTYAEGIVDGHADFRGCAIGCLATPHTKVGLRTWLRYLLSPTGSGIDQHGAGDFFEAEEDSGERVVIENGAPMVTRLRSDFGITPELARIAEWVFEALPSHAGAIDFLPAFARHLPEGADIQPADVRRFWDSVGGGYVSFENGAHYGGGYNRDEAEVHRVRDKLFAWLDEQKVLVAA